MKKFIVMAIVIVSVLFMITAEAKAQQNIYINPSKGVGNIELDMTAAQVEQIMGKPARIMDSVHFKDIQHYIYYSRYKMNVTIKKDTKRVVEIAVYAPHYKISNGISVGSKKIRVEQEYGKKPQVVNQGEYQFLFYRSAGVNFGLKKDVVKVITVRGPNYSSSEVLYMGR